MDAEKYVSDHTLSGNSYEKCKIMTDGFWDCIQTLHRWNVAWFPYVNWRHTFMSFVTRIEAPSHTLQLKKR